MICPRPLLFIRGRTTMLSRGDTVYTDSNLSDWLVAREDKTDDEN